jgi:hypothetical protein
MVILVENINLATIQAFLFGIPESIDVLIFGVGLVFAAVTIRRYLGRVDLAKRDEKFGEKA